MVDPVNLRVNGSSTWLKDANTQMITVSRDGSGSAVRGLWSSYTGTWTSFVVPVGSKFIPLVVQFSFDFATPPTGTGSLILSDGAYGVAGMTHWNTTVNDGGKDDIGGGVATYDVYLDNWAAGEYMNVTVDTTAYWGVSITGILTTV